MHYHRADRRSFPKTRFSVVFKIPVFIVHLMQMTDVCSHLFYGNKSRWYIKVFVFCRGFVVDATARTRQKNVLLSLKAVL